MSHHEMVRTLSDAVIAAAFLLAAVHAAKTAGAMSPVSSDWAPVLPAACDSDPNPAPAYLERVGQVLGGSEAMAAPHFTCAF